jgi:hypothetical protein
MEYIAKNTIVDEFNTLRDIHEQLLTDVADKEEYNFLSNKLKQFKDTVDIINRLEVTSEESICVDARRFILFQVEEFLKDFMIGCISEGDEYAALVIENLLEEFDIRFNKG